MTILSVFAIFSPTDVMMIVAVILCWVVPILAVVLLVRFLLSRSKPTAEKRLNELTELKARGLIADEEYEIQRDKILSDV